MNDHFLKTVKLIFKIGFFFKTNIENWSFAIMI